MDWLKLFSLSHSTSNRLAWMDYAKGIAISMVALRHAFIGVYNENIGLSEYAYDLANTIGVTFRMPLFFLLSGIFFRISVHKRTGVGYLLHKSRTILHPYLVWSFLVTTLQIIFSQYTTSDATLAWYGRIAYAPWGHWWFLYVLFVISVAYLVFSYLLPKNKLYMGLLGLGLYFSSVLVLGTRTPFFILTLFIFFALGDILSDFFLKNKYLPYTKSGWIIFSSIVLAAVGEYILYQPAMRESLALNLIFALTGSACTILIANVLADKNIHWLGFIRTLGQHSLYIYLLHVPIEASLRILFVKFLKFDQPYPVVAITYIIGLVVPVFIYRIMSTSNLEFFFVYPTSAKNAKQEGGNKFKTA